MAISPQIARSSNNKGLTLVEVIVSVLLLAIVGAGTFAAFSIVQYTFGFRKHRIEAYSFAREALDRLRSNYKYTDSQMSALVADNPHLSAEIGFSVPAGSDMPSLNPVLTYDVEAVAGVPVADGFKKVTVKFQWDE